MRVTGLILVASMLWLSPVNAASTAVAERYVLSISGVDIGEADLTINKRGDAYETRMQGGFRFLVWSGKAEITSLGTSRNAAFEPKAYSSRFESAFRLFKTDIAFGPAGIRSTWEATPPFDPEDFGERVPLRDADLVGAKDMLSAFVIPAKSGVAACGQTLKVFSGIVRFDLDLVPLGSDDDGGTVYCAGAYRPIAGHRIEPGEVDRLQRDGVHLSLFEMMPGIWAPHSVGFSTRFGTMTLTRAVE